MHCSGSLCINVFNGKAYDKNQNPCDSAECKALEKKLKTHLDKFRFGSGGPTNAEIAANRLFNILESGRTGFGKLLSS
jgi:hypothetical protein